MLAVAGGAPYTSAGTGRASPLRGAPLLSILSCLVSIIIGILVIFVNLPPVLSRGT